MTGAETVPKALSRLLDETSYPILVVAALLFGLLPPEAPHLVEKVQMLVTGTLHRPIDWFDLLLHSAPLLLLTLKGARDLGRRAAEA